MNKVNIEGAGNSKVRIVYNVKPHDYFEENKKEIVEKFCRKYGVDKSQVEVAVKYIDKTAESSVCIDPEKISSIQDPEFQLELIRKYFEENGVEGIDFERIRQIDSQVNSRVDFDKYEKKSTYKINYIKFSNFLSYGDENFLDFRDFNGLVLLRGFPANQSGKTTLCNDLVHFALFGKTKSGKADSNAQIFNKFRPDKNEVNVEASITVKGEEYIIIRTLKRPEKRKKGGKVTVTNTVQYYRKHDGDVMEEIEDCDNLQAESTTKTNQLLKEAIGSEKDFDLMSCINAPNLSEIIYLGDADRSRSMIRWFGLQSIEDKSQQARDIWNKEVSIGRYCDRYNKEALKRENEEIEGRNKELESAIEKNVNLISASETKEKELNGKLELLIKSLRNINPELEKIDYQTLVKSMKDLGEVGKDKAGNVARMKGEMASMPEKEFSQEEYAEINGRVKELIAMIAEVKSQIKELKVKNQILQKGEYCPTCGRKLDNVDNSKAIAENEALIKTLIANGIELNKEKEEKESRSAVLDETRRYIEERNKLQLRIAQAEVEVSMYRDKYKEKLSIKKEIESNREAIEYNNSVQNDINICKANITAESNQQSYLRNENQAMIRDRDSGSSQILNNNSIIVTIDAELENEKYWKLYNQAIGKDGITKMILRESIPLLNSQITNLLRSSDIDFDVEIRMTDKNEIQFILKKGDIEAPLASGSGYEQLVSSLVLRTVISQFSMISKPPFIILDEILGSVSSENLPKVRKLFEHISSLYDFVFHITHLEDVVDWHNKIITVRKVNNVSSINEE